MPLTLVEQQKQIDELKKKFNAINLSVGTLTNETNKNFDRNNIKIGAIDNRTKNDVSFSRALILVSLGR